MIWEEARLAFPDVFFDSGKEVTNGRESWSRANNSEDPEGKRTYVGSLKDSCVMTFQKQDQN